MSFLNGQFATFVGVSSSALTLDETYDPWAGQGGSFQDVINAVQDTPNAMGYMFLSNYNDLDTGGVTAVSVNNIEPTMENVQDQSYEYQSVMYLAYKDNSSGTDFATDFIEFVVSPAATLTSTT